MKSYIYIHIAITLKRKLPILLEFITDVVIIVGSVFSSSSSRLVSGTEGNLERVLRISLLSIDFKPFKDSALSRASFIRSVNLTFASASIIFCKYNINKFYKFK